MPESTMYRIKTYLSTIEVGHKFTSREVYDALRFANPEIKFANISAGLSYLGDKLYLTRQKGGGNNAQSNEFTLIKSIHGLNTGKSTQRKPTPTGYGEPGTVDKVVEARLNEDRLHYPEPVARDIITIQQPRTFSTVVNELLAIAAEAEQKHNRPLADYSTKELMAELTRRIGNAD